jgi:hypothetical protein
MAIKGCIGVIQLRGGLGLPLETDLEILVGYILSRQKFQGYLAVEFVILRQVNLPHAPGAKLFENLILKYGFTDH